MGDKIQYDNPKTMEETIRKEKFLYEQQRENPTFQKAWEDKKKFKKEQRQKGNKPPFFINSLQGQPVLREPRMAEIGGQRPRQTPMQCWGSYCLRNLSNAAKEVLQEGLPNICSPYG